jgi:hypothetical protein
LLALGIGVLAHDGGNFFFNFRHYLLSIKFMLFADFTVNFIKILPCGLYL